MTAKQQDVTLWPSENQAGVSKTITSENPDLTQLMPNGVTCIELGNQAGNWQAFTEVSYNGAQAILNEGRLYKSLQDMGLNKPVKSMRKAPE